jgi:tetratricopeptide (TPR) repeat protein
VALLVQESRLYLIMKDYEGCAATVEQILGIEPSNADALYIKGMALMENDKMDLAIESFRMVILNNQKHYDALMQLGFIYEDRDPKIAIEYFKSATLARPESIEALYNLALLYQENMEPDKAIQSYESIIKLDSTYKEAYYNIGYVNLVYREKFHDGIEYFDKAIKLDSVYSDAYFNRGYCYELLKMKTEARRDYQKVLSLNTNDQKAVDGMNRLDKLK